MNAYREKLVINQKHEEFKLGKVLENKSVIILFFCKPNNKIGECLMEILKEVYTENNLRQSRFEIILVCPETDRDDYDSFLINNGPWYAIPHESEFANELRIKYEVTCFPALIVLKPDGQIVTQTPEKDLETLGINVLVVWNDI